MSSVRALDEALVRTLSDGFGGSVLLPADDDYGPPAASTMAWSTGGRG